MLAEKEIDNSIVFEPGVYDISSEEYHSSEGISRSGILLFRKSPFHFWHKYIRPDREKEESTKAMIIGNALHTYVLEPEKFNDEYYVCPKIDKRTKEGKDRWAEIQPEIGTKQLLDEDVYQSIISIADSIKKTQLANNLIIGAKFEKSIYWNDAETGLLCKCRPDIWHSNFVCDLKTSADASPREFQRAIYNYGYHVQAAMIQDALRITCNQKVDDFFFVVVEKEEPYATAIYQLDGEAIQTGREEFRKLMRQYKACKETNEWPSYESKEISLPSFVYYL